MSERESELGWVCPMWDWSSPTRYGNQCASVPKDGIGENHKSQLLRLVSVIRFARCEVISVTAHQAEDQTKPKQFMAYSPPGGTSGRPERGAEGRG